MAARRGVRASVLTAAVAEERAFAPERPTTTATPAGDGYRLSGSKAIVPAGPYADAFLVPAETPTGVGVFLVLPGDAGVTVTEQHFSDRDAVARVDLDGVRPRPPTAWSAPPTAPWTGGSGTCCCSPAPPSSSGSARARWRSPRRTPRRGSSSAARSAPSRRSRSGWPTATSTRSAQRLALWQAAWRLDEGLPADTEVAIAKLWAADAGHRIAHTTVHVHGGVGIDLDGEAHRYFTSAKRYEFLHGGATEQALRIGRTLGRPSRPDAGLMAETVQQLLRERAEDDRPSG